MASIFTVRSNEERSPHLGQQGEGRHYNRACWIISLLAAATASPAYAGNGEIYVGAFGGVAWPERQEVRQSGMAHRRGEWRLDEYRDFDLPVAVQGRSEADTG